MALPSLIRQEMMAQEQLGEWSEQMMATTPISRWIDNLNHLFEVWHDEYSVRFTDESYDEILLWMAGRQGAAWTALRDSDSSPGSPDSDLVEMNLETLEVFDPKTGRQISHEELAESVRAGNSEAIPASEAETASESTPDQDDADFATGTRIDPENDSLTGELLAMAASDDSEAPEESSTPAEIAEWWSDSGWDWLNPWTYPILRLVPNVIGGVYRQQLEGMEAELDAAEAKRRRAIDDLASGKDDQNQFQESKRLGPNTAATIRGLAEANVEFAAGGASFIRPAGAAGRALRRLPKPPRGRASFRSTQTRKTGTNASRLRTSMGSRLAEDEQAHHIVASTHRRAQEARDLLDYFHIDINGTENGVGLARSVHERTGLHTNPGIAAVTERLQMATRGVRKWESGRAAVIQELRKIGDEIKAKKFKP